MELNLKKNITLFGLKQDKRVYETVFKEYSRSDKHESDFNAHHDKYCDVMKQITQTGIQRKDFKTMIITKVIDDKPVCGKEIINFVTFPEPIEGGLPTAALESRAEVFVEKSLAVQRSLVFTDFKIRIPVFKEEFTESLPYLAQYKKQCLEFDNVPYDNNYFIVAAIEKFVGALKVCAENDKCLFVLGQFAKESELLTSLTCHKTIAIVCGARIFYATSAHILKEGGFSNFINSVLSDYKKKELIGKTIPMSIYEICWERRSILIPAFSFVRYTSSTVFFSQAVELSKVIYGSLPAASNVILGVDYFIRENSETPGKDVDFTLYKGGLVFRVYRYIKTLKSAAMSGLFEDLIRKFFPDLASFLAGPKGATNAVAEAKPVQVRESLNSIEESGDDDPSLD
jgi:hypothetical protein